MVIEVVSIDSEKVTEMLSVRAILLMLSVVEEIEYIDGAVVSVSLSCWSSFLHEKKIIQNKKKQKMKSFLLKNIHHI